MKKVIYSILFVTTVVLTSCDGETKSEEHNHVGHEHSSDDHKNMGVPESTSSTFIDSYLSIKEGLVGDDSEATAKSALMLIASLENVNQEGLSAEEMTEVSEILESMKENAEHISNNSSEIAHQREHLVILSSDVKDLIAIVGTDKKLYQDFCPMYKNDGAMWLSDTKEIENPYYGESILSCGSIQEELE